VPQSDYQIPSIQEALEILAVSLMNEGVGMPELRFSKDDLRKIEKSFQSQIAVPLEKHPLIPNPFDVNLSKIHTAGGSIELKEK